MNIARRVALITGSTRGIGRAIASRLARDGFDIVLHGTSEAGRGDSLATELADACGVGVYYVQADLRDSEQIESLFKLIFSKSRRLDVLVNNAGILRDQLLGMIAAETLDDVIGVNLRSVILATQAGGRLMARSGGGSIINISSIIGRVGNSGQAVYSAAKAGVLGLTYASAKELGGKGIRVNAIAPGFIETDMTRSLPAERADELMGGIVMGRAGTPEDVAGVASFLASADSSYVTGQVIGVDGGLII